MWASAASGNVILSLDFDGPDAAAGVRNGRLVAGVGGGRALLIERDSAGSTSETYSVAAERIAGQRITIRARVKAEGVSRPPNSWNGIKVMLVLETNGAKEYPQVPIPRGSFAWREFVHVMRVPAGVDKATLVLGLEAVSGRAWFDDVSISLGRPGSEGKRAAVRFTGRNVDRLRGVMYGPTFREADIRELATEWKANQIRWQLNWVPMKAAEDWAADLDRFDAWLEGALAECDKALDACEKYGIHVLVDLHTPPGGRVEGGVCRKFSEKKYQDKLIEVWKKIATRYKGRQVVYAYDIVNEIVEGSVAPGLMDWRTLATEVTKAIREIDPGKPVVFEPSPWGGPDGFDALLPLEAEGVIYSFHMYKPHEFTHQSVHGGEANLVYPGIIAGRHYDKEALREAMRAAIDFQEEFNVHIYVGEFSAIRWAPDNSAYRYLRDVIELFEEYGWDWSYHAFREWDGWSVEHGTVRQDRRPTARPTDREMLLKAWFARNEPAASGRGSK
jgi:hypothetical protein